MHNTVWLWDRETRLFWKDRSTKSSITTVLREVPWTNSSSWESVRSFVLQNRFGESLGEDVWEACNAVFDRMPLAAVIDRDIFCVHGGIPRALEGSTSRIQV